MADEGMVEAIINRWPVLVVFGLLGALIAFVVGLTLPPVYEATAVVAFGINFDRDPPWRKSEQDLAEGRVVGFISSNDVLERGLEEASRRVSPDELPTLDRLQGQVDIVRKESIWELSVADGSPEVAAALANAWAMTAEEAFWEAHAHAIAAENTQTQLDALGEALAEAKADPLLEAGQNGYIEQLESHISNLELALNTELDQAKGTVTFMSLNLSNNASVPTKPSARDSRIQIVAGSLLGILAGYVFLVARDYWRSSRRC